MAYTGDKSIGKHPTRPDAEDCSFFVRTGRCKFGSSCKFNHPVLTENLVDGDKSQIPCKFYTAGLCKYRDSCRFSHPKAEAENLPLQVNYLGYPKRLGKMNCSFYMRTGMCGYGVSCRFHHPDPIMIFHESMSKHKEAVNSTQPYYSLPLITSDHFSGVHQNCVLSRYQVTKGKEKVDTNEDYTPKKQPCVLNDVGLPTRLGKKVCWNYENLGLCKQGRGCAYDHPNKHSSLCGSTSASSSGVKPNENVTPKE